MELIIVEYKTNVQGGTGAETDKGPGEFATKSNCCIVWDKYRTKAFLTQNK